MDRLIFVIGIIIIFTPSCKKENNSISPSYEAQSFQSTYNNENLEEHPFLSAYEEFISVATLCYTPLIETISAIDSIQDYFTTQEISKPGYLDLLSTHYGNPLWSFPQPVYIDDVSNTLDAWVIPLISNTEPLLSGILFCTSEEEGRINVIYQIDYIDQVLNDPNAWPEEVIFLSDIRLAISHIENLLFCNEGQNDDLDNRSVITQRFEHRHGYFELGNWTYEFTSGNQVKHFKAVFEIWVNYIIPCIPEVWVNDWWPGGEIIWGHDRGGNNSPADVCSNSDQNEEINFLFLDEIFSSLVTFISNEQLDMMPVELWQYLQPECKDLEQAEFDICMKESIICSFGEINNDVFACLMAQSAPTLFEYLALAGELSPDCSFGSKLNEIYSSCGCNFILGGADWESYDDDDTMHEEEPKWGNLGSCEEIIEQINALNIDNNLSIEDQSSLIAEHFNCNAKYDRDTITKKLYLLSGNNICDIPKYFYSQIYGWIDVHHVFKIFLWAVQHHNDEPWSSIYDAAWQAETKGYAAEAWQWTQDNISAFSYEDLCSNHLGSLLFLTSYNDIEAGNKTWAEALSEMCSVIEAVPPTAAPNYGYIPYMLDENYPKIFNPLHCLVGPELFEAAQLEYCQRDLSTMLKIIDAHRNLHD